MPVNTTVARLRFEIDSNADSVTGDLRSLEKQAARTSREKNKLEKGSKRVAGEQKRLGNEARRTNRRLKNQEREGQKLSAVLFVMAKRVAAVFLIYQSFAVALAGVRKIITSSAEYEDLTAQLTTVTGSVKAAVREFGSLRKIAADLPFSLVETTQAFVKLANFGLDPNREALVSYANTASATGKRLAQFVEAVADAITFEFERLKEFGILARQTDDTVRFVFRGISTEVARSSEDVEKYLRSIGSTFFTGAAAERINTLGGSFNNFQDAIFNFSRAIGESTGLSKGLTSTLLGTTKALNAYADASDKAGNRDIPALEITEVFQNLNAEILRSQELTEQINNLPIGIAGGPVFGDLARQADRSEKRVIALRKAVADFIASIPENRLTFAIQDASEELETVRQQLISINKIIIEQPSEFVNSEQLNALNTRRDELEKRERELIISQREDVQELARLGVPEAQEIARSFEQVAEATKNIDLDPELIEQLEKYNSRLISNAKNITIATQEFNNALSLEGDELLRNRENDEKLAISRKEAFASRLEARKVLGNKRREEHFQALEEEEERKQQALDTLQAINEVDIAFQQAIRDAQEGFQDLKSSQERGGILGNILGEGRIDFLGAELAAIKEHYDLTRQLISDEEDLTHKQRIDKLTALRKDFTSRVDALQLKEHGDRVKAEERLQDDLLTLARTGNKEFGILYKAAAIAQTTIDTYTAAQAAYKALAGIPVVGPGLATAAAGIAVAAGLVRIANIQAQNFQEGGIAGLINTGSTFGDRTPVNANRGEMFINRRDQGNLLRFIQGGSLGGGSPRININMYGAPEGARVETSQNDSGEQDVDIFFGDAVRNVINRDLATGEGVSLSFESVFGTRRVG